VNSDVWGLDQFIVGFDHIGRRDALRRFAHWLYPDKVDT
jgi:hypothetical protein